MITSFSILYVHTYLSQHRVNVTIASEKFHEQSDNPDARALTIHLSRLANREMFHYLVNSYKSGAKYKMTFPVRVYKKFCCARGRGSGLD